MILRHLLPLAVTIQKTDLKLDLPPCHEIPVTVTATPELLKRHKILVGTLMDAIKADAFTKRQGKLFGALAEVPSHLDRSTEDTGNVDGGSYTIRYPESAGGDLVAFDPPSRESVTSPKEKWLLTIVGKELAEGRRCLVLGWHAEVLPRLARLIQKHVGVVAPMLDPAKVPTAKRKAWIDTQIIAKNRKVLVVNPVCVQTGLNNLVHFATTIFMENPACNPLVKRQVVGRTDRIGQDLETRVYFPVYEDSTQVALHKLLEDKVRVSMATDGLDVDAALEAAGAGTTSLATGLSVGKQLYKLLAEGY